MAESPGAERGEGMRWHLGDVRNGGSLRGDAVPSVPGMVPQSTGWPKLRKWPRLLDRCNPQAVYEVWLEKRSLERRPPLSPVVRRCDSSGEDPSMLVISVDAIVEALRAGPILRADQAQQLDDYARKFQEPTKFVSQLIKLGWLTLYQGKKILAGLAGDLVFGPYLILDKLGEGGMGKVYKARQLRMERLVALKVVRPDLLVSDVIRGRFLREARAAAKLDDPNIVRLLDADQVGTRYFLAMELVEGVDLSRMVRENGPLTVPSA